MADSVTFDFSSMATNINAMATKVKTQLDKMQSNATSGGVGVADMFSMQLAMNQMSQLTEMSSSVLSAANSSMMSMARNIKS